MFLTIAIGNTNLRLAVFENGRLSESRCLPLAGDPIRPESFAEFRGARKALIASVHPTLLPSLLECLRGLGIEVSVAGRDFSVPVVNRYRRPGETGLDRLLGILAAGRLFPGEGVVVVDFGTALTINVGSPAGEFLGGYIGVGASTGAAALAQRAPRLPRIDLVAPGAELPGETRMAINDGIIWQTAGGVERILAELRNLLPWKFRVAATGGDAALLLPRIAGIDRHEPELVLQGIWLAYEASLARADG